MKTFKIKAQGSTGKLLISTDGLRGMRTTYNPYSGNLMEEIKEKATERIIEYFEKEGIDWGNMVKKDYRIVNLWDEGHNGILALVHKDDLK